MTSAEGVDFLVAVAVADIVSDVGIGCNRLVVIERCVMILRIDFKFSIYIFNQNKRKMRKMKNVKNVKNAKNAKNVKKYFNCNNK